MTRMLGQPLARSCPAACSRPRSTAATPTGGASRTPWATPSSPDAAVLEAAGLSPVEAARRGGSRLDLDPATVRIAIAGIEVFAGTPLRLRCRGGQPGHGRARGPGARRPWCRSGIRRGVRLRPDRGVRPGEQRVLHVNRSAPGADIVVVKLGGTTLAEQTPTLREIADRSRDPTGRARPRRWQATDGLARPHGRGEPVRGWPAGDG